MYRLQKKMYDKTGENKRNNEWKWKAAPVKRQFNGRNIAYMRDTRINLECKLPSTWDRREKNLSCSRVIFSSCSSPMRPYISVATVYIRKIEKSATTWNALLKRNESLCAIYFSDVTLITSCNSNKKRGQRRARKLFYDERLKVSLYYRVSKRWPTHFFIYIAPCLILWKYLKYQLFKYL